MLTSWSMDALTIVVDLDGSAVGCECSKEAADVTSTMFWQVGWECCKWAAGVTRESGMQAD